jgi:hypothetical protein
MVQLTRIEYPVDQLMQMALIISKRVVMDVLLITITVVWSESFCDDFGAKQPIAQLLHLDAAAHFT